MRTSPGLPGWVHAFAWGITILLTLTLIWITHAGAGGNLWESWRPSSDLHRSGYAERIYFRDVVRTRANTWSNLGFVVVGLYTIALGWHDLRRSCPRRAGYLVRTPAMSMAFGLACCALGAGSGFFHASLTRLGQRLDVAAMYPPLMVIIAVSLGRRFPRFGRWNLPIWPGLILGVAVASALLYQYKWSMSARNTLSVLVATIGLLAALDRVTSSRALDLRWLAWSSVALIAGVSCRELDIARRFTAPDAWLQGHALWHLLTALSLGCIYLYYRSEVSTSPDGYQDTG